MKNRIWNDALCLLGMTACGAVAQEPSYAAQSGSAVPNGDDGFSRQTWTADTFRHAESLTSPSTTGVDLVNQGALTTDKYRYERVPGTASGYQYTWNSSYDSKLSGDLPTSGQPAVRYMWADGSVSSKPMSQSVVTVGNDSAVTTVATSSPGYASEEVTTQWTEKRPIQWTATAPTSVKTTQRTTTTRSWETPRRTFLRRTEYDAFSSRLTLKATFGMNVFSHFVGQPLNNIGPATGGGINRSYDNGFVNDDSAANAVAGSTWFYQYDADPAQLDAARDSLFLHSVGSAAGVKEDEKLLPGVELKYEEILGQFRGVGRRRWNVGMSAAIGAGFANYGDTTPLSGAVTVTQDQYDALAGSLIAAGGNPGGTFAGPGDLIGDSPVARTTFASPATGSLLDDLEGQLYSFRLGPFLEVPLHDRVTAVFNAGFAFVLADLEYLYQERLALTTIINGSPAAVVRTGYNDGLDTTFGGYLGVNIRVELNERWAAEVGARYQYLGTVDTTANGRTAYLDIGDVWSLNGGVSYSF